MILNQYVVIGKILLKQNNFLFDDYFKRYLHNKNL